MLLLCAYLFPGGGDNDDGGRGVRREGGGTTAISALVKIQTQMKVCSNLDEPERRISCFDSAPFPFPFALDPPSSPWARRTPGLPGFSGRGRTMPSEASCR